MTKINRAGIYVHVPFCARKCAYCDFISFAECEETQIRQYFEALKKECRLLSEETEDAFRDEDSESVDKWEQHLHRAALEVLPADSLFIGGGTPSVVDVQYIAGLMPLLPLTEGAERTLEANPGTLNREKLRIYRECGINRLSLGVQSFHDQELAFLGRIHSGEDAVASFQAARDAGFDNISLDLMFGFPGQTLASWRKTLETAVALEPDHLSFYSLQIEESTPLYQWFREDRVEQLPDELNRDMYHFAVDFLEQNGYGRYEISNAARPGKQCRHNLKYWTMAPYFGLGIGAHSFVGETRYAGSDTLDEYFQFTEALDRSGHYFDGRLREILRNSPEDSMSDYLFTGLRLTGGIALPDFERRFGVTFREKYAEALDQHLGDGTLILKEGILKFTEKGIDLSNRVLIDFL